MVTGPLAASLGVLARDRWRALGEKRLPRRSASTSDLWPSDVTPDLTDVDVAIARTMPEFGTQAGDPGMRSALSGFDCRGEAIDLHREPVLHE